MQCLQPPDDSVISEHEYEEDKIFIHAGIISTKATINIVTAYTSNEFVRGELCVRGV